MSITDYFDPVALERSDFDILNDRYSFGRKIDIFTANNNSFNLHNYQVALFGVPEIRGSKIKGIDGSPDQMRRQLYQLAYLEKNVRIIDLGNLKLGHTNNDTYFGVRDVVSELLSQQIFPVILGGSQDLTYGICMAFEFLRQKFTLTTIDNRIDILFDSYNDLNFKNYLNKIILENQMLFEYVNIGQQACYTNAENSDLFETLFHDNIRLGLLRNNTILAEPYLRDTDILSIDFAAIKHADAPGQAIASPNGFTAEEICQIARYAGFGEKTKVLGLFDISTTYDTNDTSAWLAAQVIWYFLDGYSIRLNEFPEKNPENFKQYFVTFQDENTINFFRSLITERWWCEVPTNTDKPQMIACSEKDYLQAVNNEIPDRWFKFLKKLN